MEIVLHGVESISFEKIEPLTKEAKTHTRDIYIKTAEGDTLHLNCFAESAENLKVEIEKIEKV